MHSAAPAPAPAPVCASAQGDPWAYQAPRWLPGGHAQTVWAALYAGVAASGLPLQRERWTSPDGDFIELDWQHASSPTRPMVVMFHGLEGSSQSHYARACAAWAARHDVQWVMPHFRGCGGSINLAPRAYHSGDHEEIQWVLQRLRQTHVQAGGRVLVAMGVSLGGNALMRWAGEHGYAAQRCADALAAVCAPLDLSASGHAIGEGLNRQLYTRMFLRSMKPKALAKFAQFPGLFDRKRLLAARTLYEFDDVFTAPLHGFLHAKDYWQRASALPHLQQVRLPSLLLNAQNDPFVPAHSLPTSGQVSSCVSLWQPAKGGHVGFATGRWPGHVNCLAERVGNWLLCAAQQG